MGQDSGVCEQQKRRPAFASAQSDQRHCYSLYIGQHHIKTCSIHNSMFQLVSIAEETGLSLALSDTPKTGFVEA